MAGKIVRHAAGSGKSAILNICHGERQNTAPGSKQSQYPEEDGQMKSPQQASFRMSIFGDETPHSLRAA
ncbi:MAG: hypothetical protein ACFCUR_04415 [Rhodomicrobiaceae bacterium]